MTYAPCVYRSIAAHHADGPNLRSAGARSAAKSAAFGGVLLAMIEGLGILLTRATAPPPAPPLMDMAPGGAPLPQPGHPLYTLPSAPASQRPFLGGIVSFCVGANAS